MVSSRATDAEAARVAGLHRREAGGTASEPSFDELTMLAAEICEAPIAFVSLVEGPALEITAKVGLSTDEIPRNRAFCMQSTQRPDDFLEVADTLLDPRFRESEWVLGDLKIRFYAGAPLVNRHGVVLGSLCVMDTKPRSLSPSQRSALRVLSRHVVTQLELRRSSQDLADEADSRRRAETKLREQNEKLLQSQQETSRLLALAERSRGALLSVLEDEQRTTRALARSNRALKMLSSCNEALIWADDETSLLQEICRIAVELGGHRMAWVGYAGDDDARSIVAMSQWGDAEGYLGKTDLTWAADRPGGEGPAGRCIREGKAMACGDMSDPSWKIHSLEAARARGFNSVICLPLKDKTRTFGLLGLYSGETGEVGADELRLLQDLADDLAFGIGTIRARVVKERAEAALVGSLHEKEALLKEVHHRVKNNLQVIASLLRLEGRRIEHPITRSVLQEMQGRIQSMALLHETLYRSGNFATVNLASYLTQLTQQLFRSLASPSGAVRLELDLEEAYLEIDQAIPCGLIVNELASNSLKHGFPEGRSGEVRVTMRAPDSGNTIALRVSDTGIGLPQNFDPAQKRSLGLQLVSDLARQLQGRLDIGAGPQAVFDVTFLRNRPHTGEISRPDPASRPTTSKEKA